MTTIHASHPLDVPALTASAAPTTRSAERSGESQAAQPDDMWAAEPADQDLRSPGASALTAGVSLLAVLGVFAGAAALVGFGFRALFAFFAG